jgi:hypothetical protein
MSVWRRVEQMLLQRGINTVLEVLLWITLAYTIVGVGYAMLHIELVGQLEFQLKDEFSVFATIGSVVVTVVLWPLLLGSSLLCGVAGCGVV